MTLPRLLDREAELGRLEDAWARARGGTPQLAVLWGRRRAGKTFLLSHFAEGKRALFFGATQQADAVELARLAETVGRDLGSEAMDLAGGRFASWEGALRYFAAMSASDPLLVILDEVPYLARSNPAFPSILQAVWDHLRTGTKLMLVLSGSAIGSIETMLGAGGALRGRPTEAIRLDPVDLRGARQFLPNLRGQDLIEAYSACGGYPLHLLAWDESASQQMNLERLAGRAGGILLEDAPGILYEELPAVPGYARVLAAVGRGRTRAAEIANDAGQRVEDTLEVLGRTGFLRRSTPLGSPRRARPLYEIPDAYLAFWFSVLYSDLAAVDAGQGRAVLLRRRPQWKRHVGWVFEEAARAHAVRLVARGEIPEDMVIGRWWSTTGPACEIDVMGMQGTRTSLIGEVRWQERPLGRHDLAALIAKSRYVPDPNDTISYAMWSRGGVDESVAAAGVLSYDAEAVVDQ